MSNGFRWLIGHKKVNNSNMLQLIRPCKFLDLEWCILCMEGGELIDLPLLLCLITLRLGNKLFNLVNNLKMYWVLPRSVCYMVTHFRDLGSSVRGKGPMVNHLVHSPLDCME